MEKQMTKRQHYVPQFYLRNFTDINGKLQVYNYQKNNFFTCVPKDVCYEEYLHETLWEEANPKLGKYVLPNQIEKNLSQKESQYSAALKRVIQICLEPKNKTALICNKNDKQVLANFTVNMMVRNPWILHQVDEECFSDGIMENDEIKAIDQLLQGMRFGGTKSLVKAVNKMVWLDEQFIPAQFCEELFQMNCCFLTVPEDSFVTSNFPVLYELHENENEEIYLDNVYIPIHPRIALLYSKQEHFRPYRNRLTPISVEIACLMNHCYFRFTDNRVQFIITNNQRLLDESINLENPQNRI